VPYRVFVLHSLSPQDEQDEAMKTMPPGQAKVQQRMDVVGVS